VYAALVERDGRPWPAVVNVGGRPTFGDDTRMIEVHLLDFDGDLYGQKLTVGFVARLRDVRRFASVDDLAQQIGRDVQAGREVPALRAAAGEHGAPTDEVRAT
jgi:riboflavin kinase/FMN adenylyltransferase